MDEKIQDITAKITRGSPGLRLKLSYILTVVKPSNLEEAIKCYEFMRNVLIPNIEKRWVAVDVSFNSRKYLMESIPKVFKKNEHVFPEVWEYKKEVRSL